jgi:ribosomal protein S13
MTEITQSWNWFEVFKSVIGPTIAAIFVVIGIWLKEWYDRRKAVQLWFEQYYITEGLDVLISHLSALRAELVNTMFALFAQPTSPSNLPFEVAARVQTLLHTNSLNSAYAIAQKATQHIIDELEATQSPELSKLESQKIEALTTMVDLLLESLQRIRKQLLQVKIRNKAEIYKISDHEKIGILIKVCHSEMMKEMATVQKIYELQAAGGELPKE